jgi:hypothetical protein
MGRMIAGTLALLLVLMAGVTAHEVTHKGTVVALETSKYAQPGGGVREVQELEVRVVDAKTKRPASRTFTIVDRTRIVRGGKRVALAQAAIQPGDVVEVVVDHDKPGDEAVEIRLSVR